MQGITTSFRARDIDLRRWKKAAEVAGVGWNEWIRLALLAYEERGFVTGVPDAAGGSVHVLDPDADADPERDAVEEF